MPDWQHALRNHLNLALYAGSSAREALLQGHTEQALAALASIDAAILACGEELARLSRAPPIAPPDPATLPDQRGAGQAG